MRIAVIGSRSIQIENLELYLPEGTSEIITGGARGADACAEHYARENNIPYQFFGRITPVTAGRHHCAVTWRSLRIAIWSWRFGMGTPVEHPT